MYRIPNQVQELYKSKIIGKFRRRVFMNWIKSSSSARNRARIPVQKASVSSMFLYSGCVLGCVCVYCYMHLNIL